MTRNRIRLKTGCARKARTGFTLVEMLVVIAIIGVLVALLVPAIFGAMTTARTAAITTEVGLISQAMDQFKVKYGSYPPDFSTPLDNQTAALMVNGYLKSSFRYRNADDLPIDPQTGNPLPMQHLDQAEALYFWLGGSELAGNPEGVGPFPHRGGFCDSPSNPLNGLGTRTPLFDFDQSRLTDKDGDGFLEYHPSTGNAPYIYYSSQATRAGNANVGGYVQNYNNPDAAFYNRGPVATTQKPAPRPYQKVVPQVTRDVKIGLMKTDYAAQDKFQIISAGVDGEFGITQPIDDSAAQVYGFPEGPYDNTGHKDNVTNFAQGSLESNLE